MPSLAGSNGPSYDAATGEEWRHRNSRGGRHDRAAHHPHGPRIVVGVGPEEFESALAFAAAEAVRAGCGLHLVHAVDLTPIPADHVLIPAADVEAWGAARLAEAVKVADDLVGDAVPVTHELVRGTPVGALVEVGRTARMVVLEHRHLSRLSRIVNRTVAGGVAAHLRVPVVAVPSGWRPDGEPRVVVAGVDVPERADEVLRAALAEAHARGARLRLVHSWSIPTPYESSFTAEEVRGWSDSARAEVCAALDRVGDLSAADGRRRTGGAGPGLGGAGGVPPPAPSCS